MSNAGLGSAANTVPIYLDNVRCSGSEARLFDCPANPIGTHNCVHNEDAGVRCLLRKWQRSIRERELEGGGWEGGREGG